MSFFVQLLLLNQTDGKNMIYHCHRLLKAYAVCPLSHANDVS